MERKRLVRDPLTAARLALGGLSAP